MVSLGSRFAVACLLSVSVAGVAAQGPPPGQARPSTATPARDAPKPGDTKPGVIKGRVTSADGRPLRRARVRATSPSLREALTGSTDVDGAYELTDVPEGRYTVNVFRNGYLSLAFGQKYPGELGRPVVVGAGQTVIDIDVVLPKAGVIAGRILDEVGDPMAGVQVHTMQQRYYQGRRRLVAAGSAARTDDTGQYRVIGLAPGSYQVLAVTREFWVAGKDKTELTFAPTYYPGATSMTQAQAVRIGIGQEASNIDFALLVGRTAAVSGVALNAAGLALAGGTISLSQEFLGPSGGTTLMISSTTTAPDGSWRLRSIPPGEFRLSLRPGSTGSTERVTQNVVLDGVDIEGLTLGTSAGGVIAGRVLTSSGAGVADSSQPGDVQPAPFLTRLRVASRPPEGPPAPVPPGDRNGSVDEMGRFELAGVAGAQRLVVSGIPDGWAIKAIEHDGEDITESDVNLKSGERLEDVRVVLTDRLTVITGTVATEKGDPSSSGTVVVFANDPALWGERSRQTRAVRPGQNGAFEIKGLPPGDYRAIAIEYIPEGDWLDPEVLGTLRDRATRFALVEAETRSLSLRLRN